MDPILVREYRARWQAISEVEEAEQQRATVEDRWGRLNAIYKWQSPWDSISALRARMERSFGSAGQD